MNKIERTPLSLLEKSIISKLATATYPPATACKRFIRDLNCGYIMQLSHRGRKFLAFIAHRFRRQYLLTEEEWAWVNAYLEKTPESDPIRHIPLSLF